MRVRNTASTWRSWKGQDSFICELAALLHDVADDKFNESAEVGLAKIDGWMREQDLSDAEWLHVLAIVAKMSFKGGSQKENVETLEGKIVQDADRLDALGAIGIARTMCYSGHSKRPIHDPRLKP